MTFKDLNLNQELLDAVIDMGFEIPSEIQRKAIPVLLSEEKDLVALAQTGTGKTAAFGFPMIQRINVAEKQTQAIVIAPTRELCLQITNDLKVYSKYVQGINIVAVYGGASITEQAKKLKQGCQIIVATPGRMQDMISRGYVKISNIQICVLDEADEMLNMGFYQDITEILSHTPKDKKTWLFSATMPNEVANISKKFMKNPLEITIGNRNQGNVDIEHEYYMVGGRDRYLALKRLADYNPGIFSVIFCRTKRDTQQVAEKLIEDGYNAAALHGDLNQNQRDLVMKGFRGNQIQMLVATDVAARGIDVDNISHVINYQLPDELETYVHRSGRTGRAGNKGVSMVIITKSEASKIRRIEKIIEKQFVKKNIPKGIEICKIQLFNLAKGIKNIEPDNDIDEYLPKIYEIFEDIDKDTLIKKMVSVEFNRFYNYYKDAKDIDSNISGASGSSERDVRYFINLGEKDGFDWKSMKDFIKESLGLEQDDVFKVDVMGGFSFFNTDIKHKQKAIALNGNQYEGRVISVEESKQKGKSNKYNVNKKKKFNRYTSKSFSSGGEGRKKRGFTSNKKKY